MGNVGKMIAGIGSLLFLVIIGCLFRNSYLQTCEDIVARYSRTVAPVPSFIREYQQAQEEHPLVLTPEQIVAGLDEAVANIVQLEKEIELSPDDVSKQRYLKYWQIMRDTLRARQ